MSAPLRFRADQVDEPGAAVPHVAARNLAKSFGARAVLAGVSLEVHAGDVVGVLGKNGAGKTTLMELLLGFSPPTGGEVALFGHPSHRLPGEAKARIGFVPQQDELIDALRGGDQLRVVGSFYRQWDLDLLHRLAALWEVDLDERIRGLSVGQRQKLSILTALGHRPDLLVLDEPVAGLDPIARRRFLEQIVEISADGARSVVFSSHIVSDVERLANKLWILRDGRLYWSGSVDALKESMVRVHIRGRRGLPDNYRIPNARSCSSEPGYACGIVQDWSPALRRRIELETGGEVEAEHLGLEEIFLELHR